MLRRSVALLIETSNAYARGLLEGIITYTRQNDAWSFYLPEQERGARPPDWLARWKGDGIIARIESDAIASFIRKCDCPTVDLSAARRVPDLAWVETDDEAIARLAAEHLLERGFRNLGFCGDPGFAWSHWREQHFQRIVEEAGASCFVHQSIPAHDPGYSWNREKAGLTGWLEKLPRPIGIMAGYYIKAQQLLDVCRELNIAVPEEVAVIGVYNDTLLCNLSTPSLTSVIPNSHRTGFEAARLLDRMMSGEQVPAEAHLVKPLGIETRQSTDIFAIDDVDVATALRFIRERACSGINVGDVLKAVPLSRRVLESRFQKAIGRTPHQEITRLRIERVKQLLSETKLSLAEIATRAGIEHVEYLSASFKRETGSSPREFRIATSGRP